MNRSLEIALLFSGLAEEITQTLGAKAWFQFQETGNKAAQMSIDDTLIFERLAWGFKMADAQILMWIDEIVSCALDNTGWYWFWHELEDAPACIRHMGQSLRRSIEREGLLMFLARHPKFLGRSRWREYVFG